MTRVISEPMIQNVTKCTQMKLIVSLILLITISSSAKAQDVAKDSLYIVTYTTGPTWDSSKAPGDQFFFKEHSQHLSSLRKDGVITMGARYADKGIIVIKAKSYSHAQEIVTSDEAIANQLFNTDIQKLNVFYPGCVER